MITSMRRRALRRRVVRFGHACASARAPARRDLGGPQPVQDRFELGRQRRLRPDQRRRRRRGELEPPGVEEEPLEAVRARRDVPVP